jgi:hypothetical protein
VSNERNQHKTREHKRKPRSSFTHRISNLRLVQSQQKTRPQYLRDEGMSKGGALRKNALNGQEAEQHLQWFFHFLSPNATSQFKHLCTAASGTHVSAIPLRKRVQSSFSACSCALCSMASSSMLRSMGTDSSHTCSSATFWSCKTKSRSKKRKGQRGAEAAQPAISASP